MDKSLNWRETIITAVVKTCGYSAIVFVVLIFFFLLREGLPALAEVKLGDLLTTRWYPIENHFGILPLITGSLDRDPRRHAGRHPIRDWDSRFHLRNRPALDA